MKIVIKAKDYSPVDLKKEGTVNIPDNTENGDLNTVVARAVAWAFLSDVESGRYIDFVHPIYKRNGKIDVEKEKIVTRELDRFTMEGIVGVLRNKSFEPLKYHSDDIRYYLEKNGFYTLKTDQGAEENGILELFRHKFDVTLQIGSRFDSDKKQFFLESMFIDEPFDLKDTKNDVPPDDESILDFLILFLFKQQLQKAYENGPYRKYVRYERNDSRLKGSIDIARHIRLNAGLNNGKVAYSYRENTADNNIIHLIIYAFEHALKHFPEYSYSLFFEGDNPISCIINELRTMAPSFAETNLGMVMTQSERVIDHPYYYKYEALRKTCLMMLRFDGLSMFDGIGEDIQGVLFYIPTLWEHFLERHFIKILGNPFARQMDAQYTATVYVKPGKGKGSHETYPDFVFFADAKKTNPLFILDAKFKKRWGDRYGGTTLAYHDDFIQCLGYMSTLGTRATGVIFPLNENTSVYSDKPHEAYEVSPRNTNNFFTIPVRVPDSEKYDSYFAWKMEFEKSVIYAIRTLKGLLDKELTAHTEQFEKEARKKEICRKIENNIKLDIDDLKFVETEFLH